MERINNDENLNGNSDMIKEVIDEASLKKSVQRGLDNIKTGRVTVHADVMDELRRKLDFNIIARHVANPPALALKPTNPSKE